MFGTFRKWILNPKPISKNPLIFFFSFSSKNLLIFFSSLELKKGSIRKKDLKKKGKIGWGSTQKSKLTSEQAMVIRHKPPKLNHNSCNHHSTFLAVMAWGDTRMASSDIEVTGSSAAANTQNPPNEAAPVDVFSASAYADLEKLSKFVEQEGASLDTRY